MAPGERPLEARPANAARLPSKKPKMLELKMAELKMAVDKLPQADYRVKNKLIWHVKLVLIGRSRGECLLVHVLPHAAVQVNRHE